MTVLQEFKNVKLICNLSIGEQVKTDVDGYRTKDRIFTITVTDIKRPLNYTEWLKENNLLNDETL